MSIDDYNTKYNCIIKNHLIALLYYLIKPPPAIKAHIIGVRSSRKKTTNSDVVTVLNSAPLKGATPFLIISQECKRRNYLNKCQ